MINVFDIIIVLLSSLEAIIFKKKIGFMILKSFKIIQHFSKFKFFKSF